MVIAIGGDTEIAAPLSSDRAAALAARDHLDPLAVGTERSRHGGVVGVAERGPDDAPAVVELLVVALDVPGGVVGDDEDRLGPVPDRRVDFHGIDAESAVAIDRDDLAAGKSQRRRDGVRHADAETAERAGIHIGLRFEADAGEAQEIATVGDCDEILVGHLFDCIENRTRMDLAVFADSSSFAAPRHALLVASPQTLGPLRVGGRGGE